MKTIDAKPESIARVYMVAVLVAHLPLLAFNLAMLSGWWP